MDPTTQRNMKRNHKVELNENSIPPNIFGQFTWFFPSHNNNSGHRCRGVQQRNRRGRPFRRPSTPGAAAPTARSDACAARRRAGLSVPDASPALGDSGVGSPSGAGTSGLKEKTPKQIQKNNKREFTHHPGTDGGDHHRNDPSCVFMPSSKVCWSKRRFHEETPTFSYTLAGKTWKNYMFVGSVYT